MSDLTERLRHAAEMRDLAVRKVNRDALSSAPSILMREAADRIEELEAENARMVVEVHDAHAGADTLYDHVNDLSARIEELEARCMEAGIIIWKCADRIDELEAEVDVLTADGGDDDD